jgi:hypothetical protein
MYKIGLSPQPISIDMIESSKTNVDQLIVGNSTIYQALINVLMPITRYNSVLNDLLYRFKEQINFDSNDIFDQKFFLQCFSYKTITTLLNNFKNTNKIYIK